MRAERITNWKKPKSRVEVIINDERIISGYGSIKYDAWCDLEIPRLNKGNKEYEHSLRKRTLTTGKCIAIFRRLK